MTQLAGPAALFWLAPHGSPCFEDLVCWQRCKGRLDNQSDPLTELNVSLFRRFACTWWSINPRLPREMGRASTVRAKMLKLADGGMVASMC